MQTSLQFDERSPPGASSSNSASGQYYRSSRGFGYRKRGFNYRGRGGSYQRTSGSWHGRTAVKEEPLGDALAHSLLSRLEPSAHSLLNRLSPGKEGSNESVSSRPPALDERRSADGEHSRAESELETGNTDSVASSRNNSPQPSAMHDELAEQLIASALAQGKQLVEQHGLAERRSKSAASEAAVDDILAADDGEDVPFSSNVPEDSSQLANRANVDSAAVTTSSQSQSVDKTSVVEQARKLFIPVIIQNARLRNPDMDPEELEKKVVSLVTDEQCLAFVKFAQEARNQEKGRKSGGEKKDLSVLDPVGLLLRGGELPEGEKSGFRKSGSERSGLQVAAGVSGAVAAQQMLGEAGAKRQREFTDGGESSSRPAKALRRATMDGSALPTAIPLPPTVARATRDDNVRVSSSQSSSKSVKEPPTAPKAMRGLVHSQSESSAGSSLPSPPGKTPQVERTKSGTTDIADHSIGIQSSEAKHASGAWSSISEPTALLSVPLIARAPSTSSDMDIDDDSTPSPSKPPPSTQGSVQASSSSRHLPTGVSIHLSTPVHMVQTQNSLVPDPTIKRSDNVQTTPAAAEILSSAPLDGSINGNASEARENQHLPAAASNSSVVDDAASRADSSITQHPPQTLTNVLPTTEPDPVSKDRPLLQPSQGENSWDSLLSAPPAHISSNDGGSVALEDTKRDNGSASTGKLANNGFSEGSIQDSGGQKDSVTTSMSPEAVASARPTQKVQPQDNDKMDVDEKPVGGDASRVALHAPTESLSPKIDTSRNKSAAEPVGNCSISPTNFHMLGELRSTTTTMRTASPDPPSTSVDDPVKSNQRATPPGPTSLSSPYLYSAELGKPNPQVFTLRFDVGSESSAAASRWSRRQEQLDPSAPHVMFRLLCLHTADVEKAAAKNPTATPEEFASAMWDVRTKWPRRGQILLEVNGETDSPGSWIPKQLGPEDGPVDLTPHIVPGINTIRIIQLAAQTDRIFIVYAGSPPEDEVQEFRTTAAWERFVREN